RPPRRALAGRPGSGRVTVVGRRSAQRPLVDFSTIGTLATQTCHTFVDSVVSGTRVATPSAPPRVGVWVNRSAGADAVLAQGVVERRLAVGRLGAVTDDQRAREVVGAGGEVLGAGAGHDNGAGRDGASV